MTDYNKGRLRREASLQSSFYYHLRNKIGDATLDHFGASIFTEYHFKGKRVDLAVVSHSGSYPLAIYEFKYKDMVSDKPFLDDVEKIINYIADNQDCDFYIGFIQEVEFEELDDSYTWLNEAQKRIAQGRLVEMTGGMSRSNEDDPIWTFNEV